MIEERSQFSVTWISERFKKNRGGFSPMSHFFEDDDPRIELKVDRWGFERWIVGYNDEIPLLGGQSFGGELITVRTIDNSIMLVHPTVFEKFDVPQPRPEYQKFVYDIQKAARLSRREKRQQRRSKHKNRR
jgi:hypothetical protein